MRDVFTAAEVFIDEPPEHAKLVEARDRFCDAIIVYEGEASARARVPRDLRVPSRASCGEGFEQGEAAKTLGFTLLASIGKVTVSGERAEVRFRAKLPENPKKTYASAALVVRRGGRWRVVLPCEVLGCEPTLLPARQARRPRPKILDEVAGRYRGTTIGDRGSVALRRQGRPVTRRESGGSGPVGSSLAEDGTPSTWRPPGASTVAPGDLRYRGRAYLVANGRGDPPVYGLIVTDRRAETLRGVGIGDTLAFARRRYPQLRCDIVNQGTEYGSYPACRARIARRRYLGFGQNPIRSIAVMTVSFDGAR